MAPSLHDAQISFVGGGNMASAIIGGLLTKNIPKHNIYVAEPWDVNRDKMAAIGVRTTANNVEASEAADIVIIAVKPQVAKVACTELAAAWSKRDTLPLVISIAAGITVASYTQWFKEGSGRAPPIVRVMPNTPALVGEGASGLFASEDVSAAEKELATALLASVSRAAEWVDKEELLDVVTGISGSGPAYFFAFVEHLITAGINLGLSEEQASRLAKQTALGAGKMMVESSDPPSQLRKNVTSPNGTTHAALVSFEKDGFQDIVGRAVKAATDRAEELGRD
ncbi:pyrroline-5-carboxylate reductase dimerization-domain-containing protein [Mariannaea sp. PMI_226]|nr:pyrroline-5-carboxylate reductase dimerization-domain-containing protein [Mariannaea sp. PMI_226]